MEQRKNPVMIHENRLIIGMFNKNVEMLSRIKAKKRCINVLILALKPNMRSQDTQTHRRLCQPTGCELTCLCVLGGVATLNKSPWILRTGGAPLLSLGTVTTSCVVELFPPPPTKSQGRSDSYIYTIHIITVYSRCFFTHLSLGCQQWMWTDWKRVVEGCLELGGLPSKIQAEIVPQGPV